MKKTSKNALYALALGLGILGTNQVMAAAVEPELVADWQSGDAAFECGQAGGCGDFALKIDDWDEVVAGDYSDPNAAPGTAAANIITIINNNGVTFDWTSEYKVCTVIVKAGPGANIYRYPDGSCGDTGLVGPVNSNNGQNFDISHVNFCWSQSSCTTEEPPVCYQEETAWAAGTRYNNKNWAMYVPYACVETTVNIFAGQNLLAGTATFSAPNAEGEVEITIELSEGFIFYYDLNNPLDDNENVKIQDYSVAQTKNPQIGKFDWKDSAPVGSTSFSITVPKNNYYAVHLDVAYVVDCGE